MNKRRKLLICAILLLSSIKLSLADCIPQGVTSRGTASCPVAPLVTQCTLAADSNAPAAFASLISCNVNAVAGDDLIIIAGVAFTTSTLLGATSFARLVEDGTPKVGSGQSITLIGGSGTQGAPLFDVMPSVAAGSHTIVLQWRSPGTTVCNPVSNPDGNYAKVIIIRIAHPS